MRLSFLRAEQLRVVVADDDDDLRDAVIHTLQEHGCSTREACDGAQLLAMLLPGRSPGLDLDVLVTDLKMPRVSGLGVLEALRQAAWKLPVVVMTAIADPTIEAVVLRLGAVGVLHKPFDPDDLLTAVCNAGALRAGHRRSARIA